jgi:hypothetical protein
MDSQINTIILNDFNLLKDKKYLLFNALIILFPFIFKYKIMDSITIK